MTERIKLDLLFKPSNLNANFALTLGYLNPALNNPAQSSRLVHETLQVYNTRFVTEEDNLTTSKGEEISPARVWRAPQILFRHVHAPRTRFRMNKPTKTLGTISRKMVKFNLGLSQISSTVFSSKNMQLGVTKYCWVFTMRYSNDNTKCYPKQCIGM